MRRARLAARAIVLLALLGTAPSALAQEGEGATWQLEQPALPPAPPVVEPVGSVAPLGPIGDIEFWTPAEGSPQASRGLLITRGEGRAVPAGIWAYNGERWHEIASVCGATEGRIAWAGPDDFWTISDGRLGQAGSARGGTPPIEDNTLCHFFGGQLKSYAHLAFEAESYTAMHGAACTAPVPPEAASHECWFGGQSIESPVAGTFQLHWDGTTLSESPFTAENGVVRDMRAIGERLYESVEPSSVSTGSARCATCRVPALRLIEPGGSIIPEEIAPLYGERELANALKYLHLSSAGEALWGAASASTEPGEEAGQVTVVTRVGGVWHKVFGPRGEGGESEHRLPRLYVGHEDEITAEEEQTLLGGSPSSPAEASKAAVTAIAVEPGGERAWIALAPRGSEGAATGVDAVLVHVDAEGEVLGVQTLPSREERARLVGPKGAASRLTCPGVEDCWLATSEGWLFHLATAAEREQAQSGAALSELEGFPEGSLITSRPRDEGVPQEVLTAPPADTSGLPEEKREYGEFKAEQKPAENTKVRLPLLSRVRDKLIRGTTLELSFHLAVKARVRLVARRRHKIVAATATRVLQRGNRHLLLHLSRNEWPTNISLQTRALAPLPLVSSVTGEGANVTTETTALKVLTGTAAGGEGWPF